MRKFLLIISLIAGILDNLCGQPFQDSIPFSVKKSEIRHEFGGAAGGIVGIGPAYRLWNNRLGVQVCFSPFSTGKIEIYSAGLSFMYSLKKTENLNFFLYQGNHFISFIEYFSGTYSYVLYQDVNGLTKTQVQYLPSYTDKQRFFNNGFGFGVDIYNPDRKISPFGLNIQFGIAGFKNFRRSFFTGELAIMYKFK